MHTKSVVHWAILGAGFMANAFAQGLEFVPGSKLIAVGSRTRQKAEEFCRRHNVPAAYANYDRLLSDKNIDIVYVATPAALHREHCIRALESGKAVLCEKPFALNADQAKEIVAVAREKRLFCMEAMWMRFIPLMAKVFDMIQNNAIGEVRTVIAGFGAPRAYDPADRLFNPALGGGAMLDLGIYPISLACWLLGEPKAAICRATMTGSGVDEESAAIIEYGNGGKAIISASIRSQLSNDAFIVGTDGNIHVHAPIYRPHKMTYTKSGHLQQFKAHSKKNDLISRIKHVRFIQKSLIWIDGIFGPSLKMLDSSSIVSFVGNGYNYEAEVAADHVRNGLLECDAMRLDESIKSMMCADMIRHQFSYK
jgi:predicted dehydrogenase